MNGDISIALVRAADALRHATIFCPYHGDNFGMLGWKGAPSVSEPICESCRQPWRVTRALHAINRVKATT